MTFTTRNWISRCLQATAVVILTCGIAQCQKLYVGSAGTNAVLQYDAATGAFLSAFVPSASGGLSQPEGMAFGPDGNFYVASFNTNNVLKYNGTTGAFISAFVTAGSGGLTQPVGLAFGPDGNLYVSSVGTNQVLQYNGTTGAFLSTFVSAGSGGLNAPYGLAFGPDGNLYVSSLNNSSILKYNGATGAFISAFVAAGSGGLQFPFGLTFAFGTDGNLYVASFGNNSVLKFNGSTGAFISTFVPTGSGGLFDPEGLTFGPDGNLYVASFGNSQVLKYNGGTGAFMSTFVPAGSGGLTLPTFLIFFPVSPVRTTDAAYQVRYAANLTSGIDSVVNIINTGGNGNVPTNGPGFGANNGGNMCVNIYTLDPNEELLSCCSCLITPNQVVSLKVQAGIMGNTLTGFPTPSATIKLVGSSGPATAAAQNSSNCSNSAATVTTTVGAANVVEPGYVAFGTTAHIVTTGTFTVTEAPFIPAALSASELTSLTTRCASILGNASGAGVCTGCAKGALGAGKQ